MSKEVEDGKNVAGTGSAATATGAKKTMLTNNSTDLCPPSSGLMQPRLSKAGNMSRDAQVSSKNNTACKDHVAVNRASVLVVEDTDMCAKLLCMMLTKSKCTSRRAVNGKEAIDILQNATPGMFDLILMDLRMPVMGGIEATRIIKNELKLNILVIALTGDGGADMRKQCNEIGFDGFFQKPLKHSVLKQILDERARGCEALANKKSNDLDVGTDVPGTGATAVAMSVSETLLTNSTNDPCPQGASAALQEGSIEGSMSLAQVSSKNSNASKDLKARDGGSVLVVEDADTCAKLLCTMLAESNFSSRRAENGKQAIEILKSAPPGMFDLVLMDLRMPVMDGIEATRTIKSELKLDIPVLAITGDAGTDMRKQCSEVGFNGFYQKPLRPSTLKQILAERGGRSA